MEIYTKTLTRLSNTYFQFLNTFNSQISKNLLDGEFVTRPAKSNGLWCFTLIPSILILYNLLYIVSPTHNIVMFVSIGLTCYSVLFLLFLSVSCLVMRDPICGGCLASGLVPTLLMYTFAHKDLVFSLTITLSPIFLYSACLRKCLSCPKTFTIGEAMVVSQSIAISAVALVTNVYYWAEREHDQEAKYFTVISYTMLSTVGLLVTYLYIKKDRQSDIKSIIKLTSGAAVYALLVLHGALGLTCLRTIYQLIFMKRVRLQLILFWVFLVTLAVLVLCQRTRMAVKANTVTRKSFHIFGSLVFISGILVDLPLIRLASVIVFGLILLVEALRKSKIEPISSNLQAAFDVYCDEKDSGTFAMTPVYLFCGLACPLFLVPDSAPTVELLSGVLSIGVGDTAASWFGSKLGVRKWRDSNRTVVGTAFNIISQVATVLALLLYGLLPDSQALLRTAIAATAVAFVEAMTAQVDNLILPLVMILCYQATNLILPLVTILYYQAISITTWF